MNTQPQNTTPPTTTLFTATLFTAATAIFGHTAPPPRYIDNSIQFQGGAGHSRVHWIPPIKLKKA
jgi:hypothetical protein